jgi:hypothetical protein
MGWWTGVVVAEVRRGRIWIRIRSGRREDDGRHHRRLSFSTILNRLWFLRRPHGSDSFPRRHRIRRSIHIHHDPTPSLHDLLPERPIRPTPILSQFHRGDEPFRCVRSEARRNRDVGSAVAAESGGVSAAAASEGIVHGWVRSVWAAAGTAAEAGDVEEAVGEYVGGRVEMSRGRRGRRGRVVSITILLRLSDDALRRISYKAREQQKHER